MTETIGRYEVVEHIGTGGMANVYLARDPYMKRKVAIKLLPKSMTFDPDFRTRFEREAEAIAALEHPYIVPVYDFGYHDDQPFLVMRYLAGGSVKDLIEENGPLSVREAAAIIDRMASALGEAHTQGMIHRDFKPHNILIDRKGETFLADFGLVKIASVAGLTSANFITGTPAYLSPEQVYGDIEIDQRVDVYAMGITLFEMLAGHTPYQDEQPTKLMMKHVLEPVPHLTSAVPDAPEELEQVILKAMAKDPGQRYQTAGDLSAALNATSGWWGPLGRRATRRLHGDSGAFTFGPFRDSDLPGKSSPGSPLKKKPDPRQK
jgi:eukaryotic-like serine/threonine-protein kinase